MLEKWIISSSLFDYSLKRVDKLLNANVIKLNFTDMILFSASITTQRIRYVWRTVYIKTTEAKQLSHV